LSGRFLDANSAAQRISGFSLEELKGMTFADLCVPELRERTMAAFLETLGGTSRPLETAMLRRDGSRVDLLVHGAPMLVDGKLVGIHGIAADITDRKRAEAALRESEQRLRLALEAARAGTFDIDLATQAVEASPGVLKLFAFEEGARPQAGDFVARVHPADRTRVAAEIERAVAQSAGHYVEYRLAPPSGEERWVASRAEPVAGDDGKPARLIGAVLDITERRAAEHALRERERMLLLALDASGMGAWELTIADGSSRMTERAREIFGFPADASLSLARVIERIHPDDRARVAAAIQHSAATGDDFVSEYRIVRGDGALRWAASRGRPAREEGCAEFGRLVGVIADVTDRKNGEHALSLAKENAEAASRAKDDFLAALSHELRTPLNPVLMLASEQAGNGALAAEVREDFALIRKNIELEARLIDDLLDLTRISRGKVQLDVRALDVHTLLRETLEIVRGDIEKGRIALTVELAAPATQIWGDAIRLQQVFWNVLKNAVKFTPEHGALAVRTSLDSRGHIVIEISDSGLGIEPSEMGRIFNAFDQGDHVASRRFGGLGLGLTICKLLIQLHSGRISAESAGRNRGSTFRIELPLVEASIREAHSQMPVADRLPPARLEHRGAMRLLLVEDHETTRAMLARLLARRGYDITAVGTVAAAREVAAEASFDLVISDIGLPDGDGHTLMAELRDRCGLEGIALSGYGMEEDVARSLRSGFFVHLTKPVDIETLERALAKFRAARGGSSGFPDEAARLS
jgi:PAS domain S-box-containing protein